MANVKMTESAEEYKWKVENAASTLIEAEKIKKDEMLLKDVRAELKKRQAAANEAVKNI